MLEQCRELIELSGRLENQAVPHVGLRADLASLLKVGSFQGLEGPCISVRGALPLPRAGSCNRQEGTS